MRDLTVVDDRVDGRRHLDREVPGVEAHRDLGRRDPMTDLDDVAAVRWVGIDRLHPIRAAEPRRRQRETDLFDELTERRGPLPLAGIPEPAAGAIAVVGFDRATGERDVPREEAALFAPPDHEHLGVARSGVAHADRGRGLTDRSLVHGVILPGRRRGHTSGMGGGTRDADASVPAAIRGEIEANGPITFARFMELALYGVGGYYETPPVGPRGDFVTSPHVHPVFGELLARAVRELREGLDSPDPLRLTEVGAGDGTLARSLLTHLREIPVAYTAVERSPGAREALAAIEGIDVAETLEGPADLVLANELLDNLPFRIIRGDREVLVGHDGDIFTEVLAPADAEIARLARDDDERVIPSGAFAFVDELARVLTRGYALLIDYGGLGSSGGPVHGYRGHTLVEDVMAEPGSADITAGVDLELVAAHAEALGVTAFPIVRQSDALGALGIGDRLREELEEQRMQLDAGDGRAAVRTWSGRNQASLLIDPGGLGRFRWLLLATGGLDPPPWLIRASAA
jgi:SAM-dependent MidA family methyltransferase